MGRKKEKKPGTTPPGMHTNATSPAIHLASAEPGNGSRAAVTPAPPTAQLATRQCIRTQETPMRPCPPPPPPKRTVNSRRARPSSASGSRCQHPWPSSATANCRSRSTKSPYGIPPGAGCSAMSETAGGTDGDSGGGVGAGVGGAPHRRAMRAVAAAKSAGKQEAVATDARNPGRTCPTEEVGCTGDDSQYKKS